MSPTNAAPPAGCAYRFTLSEPTPLLQSRCCSFRQLHHLVFRIGGGRPHRLRGLDRFRRDGKPLLRPLWPEQLPPSLVRFGEASAVMPENHLWAVSRLQRHLRRARYRGQPVADERILQPARAGARILHSQRARHGAQGAKPDGNVNDRNVPKRWRSANIWVTPFLKRPAEARVGARPKCFHDRRCCARRGAVPVAASPRLDAFRARRVQVDGTWGSAVNISV